MSFIRYIDGQVDDVVITGDLFHLEQMDDNAWWVTIYRGDRQACFLLQWDKKRKRIKTILMEDDLSCTDDTEPIPGVLPNA